MLWQMRYFHCIFIKSPSAAPSRRGARLRSGHAKGSDSHESGRGGDHIIGAGGGVLLVIGLGGVLGGGDDDGDGAVGGRGGSLINYCAVGVDGFTFGEIIFDGIGITGEGAAGNAGTNRRDGPRQPARPEHGALLHRRAWLEGRGRFECVRR